MMKNDFQIFYIKKLVKISIKFKLNQNLTLFNFYVSLDDYLIKD